MRKYINHSIACLFASFIAAGNALALQYVDVHEDGKTFPVRISSGDITRISIQDSRITNMHFPDGALTVEKNDDLGFALVRTRTNKPVSIVITTESGFAHTLYLQPVDIPAETVVVRELLKPKTEKTRSKFKASTEPLAQQVKRLVLAMARNEQDPEDYIVEEINKEFDLWQETYFLQLDKYDGAELAGFRFQLKNISAKTMRLGEQEFYRNGVVGVAIDNHVLRPGEETMVYIVQVRIDG
jgi:conjugal transfer pilus assembly protein TraK